MTTKFKMHFFFIWFFMWMIIFIFSFNVCRVYSFSIFINYSCRTIYLACVLDFGKYAWNDQITRCILYINMFIGFCQMNSVKSVPECVFFFFACKRCNELRDYERVLLPIVVRESSYNLDVVLNCVGCFCIVDWADYTDFADNFLQWLGATPAKRTKSELGQTALR